MRSYKITDLIINIYHCNKALPSSFYRGADKSLARPGMEQATATEYFDFHISYL